MILPRWARHDGYMSTSVQTRDRAASLLRRAARLAERATTPLLPADYLDLFDPLRPGADLRGRIVDVHPETADAATIVIRPGADWAGHVPGQYVRIGIDVDGVRLWRAYSLTHGPRADGHISITVKAVPDGKVSNHLVRHARPGTLVHLEQAAGEFVLPTEGGKLLFVTAGSGHHPGHRDAAQPLPGRRLRRGPAGPQRRTTTSPSCTSRRASRTRSSSPTSATWTQAGMIRLVARYDDEHGVLDVADLADAGPRPARAHHVRLRSRPVCSTPSAPTTTSAASPCSPSSSASPPLVGGRGRHRHASASPARRSRPTAPRRSSTPPRTAGVLMPSGCRMGICYGCVLPMREGAVRDLRTGDITTASPGETGTEGVPSRPASPRPPAPATSTTDPPARRRSP